jgi:hypothetical protein
MNMKGDGEGISCTHRGLLALGEERIEVPAYLNFLTREI